jgi:outer membrane protein OmpA-like peptidoglycan-associated protein
MIKWRNIIAFCIACMIPALLQAQETYVSVRVEPGVALPLGNPQDDRFAPGFSAVVKPELSIFDVFSFGPSATVAVFPSEIDNVDAPTLWGLGGFVRVKRPHGYEWNPSEDLDNVSPWLDADMQYIRTGPLDRFGYAVGAGASWPVEDTRMLWIGPFARYQGVFQDNNLVNRNTNDSHTLVLGVSFEIGQPMKREPVLPVESKPEPKPEVKPEPKVAVPEFKDVNIELHQVIQFPWDSSKLDTFAIKQLDDVVVRILAAKEYKAIKIEGHASSEGQVPHNNKLAKRRAESVLNYLSSKGISKDKLTAVGFGADMPTASNTTESGRSINRRAEFVVSFIIVQEVKNEK